MKLVSDWKQAWRWVSMNCMAGAAAVQGAWVYVPDDMRASIPKHTVAVITIVLLVFGIVGRIVKQKD